MILDLIIRASGYVVGNFSPFVAVDFVGFHEHILFIVIPATPLDLVI